MYGIYAYTLRKTSKKYQIKALKPKMLDDKIQ